VGIFVHKWQYKYGRHQSIHKMTMVVDGGCPVDVGLSWMGWLVKEDEFKSFIEDSPVNGSVDNGGNS
jgi:hypothetical protein